MKHLFLFKIGPVQSFIAQARKTQDLYAGSQMLSDLIREASRLFVEEGGKVKFPKAQSPALPNRFLGEIDGHVEDLMDVGKKIQEKIQAYWKEKARSRVSVVLGKGTPLPIGFIGEEPHEIGQIDNHLEIYWAFQKWLEDYEFTFSSLERKIGEIKNFRPLRQYNYQRIFDKQGKLVEIVGERGRKCIMDGERNVKFYLPNEIEKDKSEVLRNKLFLDVKEEVCFANELRSKLNLRYLQPGEGLSAISFFKRCYLPGSEAEFSSTAEIALMEAENNLEKEEKQILEDYKNLFHERAFVNTYIKYCKKGDFDTQGLLTYFDYQLCFEENLEKENLKNSEQLRCAVAIQKKFKEKLDTRYYAIIVFDGDDMGKWLRGKYLQPSAKNRLEEFHEDLALSLQEFAEHSNHILSKPRGSTIYAGGDDFLGFINLEHLFHVMGELRVQFNDSVNKPLFETGVNGKEPYLSKDGSKFTFSAGLAIAHYKTPLGTVLNKAREMSRQAKQFTLFNQEKDAFAFAVMKRSGEELKTVWPWFDLDHHLQTQNLIKILKDIHGGRFSRGFIRSLGAEFSIFMDREKGSATEWLRDTPDMLRAEIVRLLYRAAEKGKFSTKKEEREAVDNFSQVLMRLYQQSYSGGKPDVRNFLNLLYLLDFLLRKSKGLALNKKEKAPEPIISMS